MLEPPCLPRSTQGEKEVNKKNGGEGKKGKGGVIRRWERIDMQDNPIKREGDGYNWQKKGVI